MKIWAYHPEEGAKIFNDIDDVPPGWADSPDFESEATQWVAEPEKEPEKRKTTARTKGKK